MVNTVGHTMELIYTLKTVGIILWVHTFTNPQLSSEVHIVSYNISIGLKIVHLNDF